MALPATGEVSYNGVTFDGRSRTKITAKPMQGKAGWTTKFIEYTLDVDGWVSDTTDTGTQLDSMRDKLTAQGQSLRYKNKGFGDLIVNAGQVRDVEWGPIPRLLSYDPVGNNLSARVRWQCTCCIPEGATAKYTTLPLDFWYELDFTIDDCGYTTIGVSGEIVIPMTRQRGGSRNVPDTVDRLREKCFPDVPLAFRRERKNWHISPDQRTAQFNYTDQELPVPLPPGTARCDIHHRVNAAKSMSKGFLQWAGYIGGQMTLARGETKKDAYLKFLTIVGSVISGGGGKGAVLTPAIPIAGWPTTQGTNKGSVFFDALSVDNALFSNTLNCGFNYYILGCEIKNFISTSGVLTDPPFDHVQWRQSMDLLKVNSPRGGAGFIHSTSEALIDLTVSVEPRVVVGQPLEKAKKPNINVMAPGNIPGLDPENSWIWFENNVVMHEEDGLARHVPIGEDGADQANPAAENLKAQDAAQGGAGLAAVQGAVDAVIQKVRTPVYRCWMVGRAVRAGYPISPPELKTIGGVEPSVRERILQRTDVYRIGDVKINGLSWRIEYVFDKPPKGKILVPANPMVRGKGGAADG